MSNFSLRVRVTGITLGPASAAPVPIAPGANATVATQPNQDVFNVTLQPLEGVGNMMPLTIQTSEPNLTVGKEYTISLTEASE